MPKDTTSLQTEPRMLPMTFNGQIVEFSSPLIMGILNTTPDSFYAPSRPTAPSEMIEYGLRMWEEGATFVDVGGQSTRPGASPISASDEADRVIPIIEALHKANPSGLISIDTYYGEVARAAVNAGACMINDISAGALDSSMWPTVAELKVPYVLMHMKGTPLDMQDQPQYDNVTDEVANFLGLAQKKLQELGIVDVVIDPGFGFGKSLTHNYELLNSLAQFQVFDRLILVGVSRKSMINKLLNINAKDALNGTTALHMIALQNGANLLRVHDVKEAQEAIEIFNFSKQVAL